MENLDRFLQFAKRSFAMALAGMIVAARKVVSANLSYRNFGVGSAVLAMNENGELAVFMGANHKSKAGGGASKGCSEPQAIKLAIQNGYIRIIGLVVVGVPQEEFPTPTLHCCGECQDFFRQLLGLGNIAPDTTVVCVNYNSPSIVERFTIEELLGYYTAGKSAQFYHERLVEQSAASRADTNTGSGDALTNGRIMASHRFAGNFKVPGMKWLNVPMSPDRAYLFARKVWDNVSQISDELERPIHVATLCSSGGDFGIARALAHHPLVTKAMAFTHNAEEVQHTAEVDHTALVALGAIDELEMADLIMLEYSATERNASELLQLLRQAYNRLSSGGKLILVDIDGGSFLYTGGPDSELPLTIDITHPRFPQGNAAMVAAGSAYVVWRPIESVPNVGADAWVVEIDGAKYVGAPLFPFHRHHAEDIARLFKSCGPGHLETTTLDVATAHLAVNKAIELRARLGKLFVMFVLTKTSE